MKIGDLVYYISSVNMKKQYAVIIKFTTDFNGKTRVWGNWYDNKQKALADKSKGGGYMPEDECFLEHINWQEELK